MEGVATDVSVSDGQHERWRDDARKNIQGIEDGDLKLVAASLSSAIFSLAERVDEIGDALVEFDHSSYRRHQDLLAIDERREVLRPDPRTLPARVVDWFRREHEVRKAARRLDRLRKEQATIFNSALHEGGRS